MRIGLKILDALFHQLMDSIKLYPLAKLAMLWIDSYLYKNLSQILAKGFVPRVNFGKLMVYLSIGKASHVIVGWPGPGFGKFNNSER